MKKAIQKAVPFFCMLCLLAGCTLPVDQETTIFNSMHVDLEDDTIVSEGEIKIHETTGTLITVEVSEDTTGTFHISYTKEKGALKITQQDQEIVALEEGAASDMTSDDYTVMLTKGRNDFVISGEDCTCTYIAVLKVDDASKIVNYGGGSLK